MLAAFSIKEIYRRFFIALQEFCNTFRNASQVDFDGERFNINMNK